MSFLCRHSFVERVGRPLAERRAWPTHQKKRRGFGRKVSRVLTIVLARSSVFGGTAQTKMLTHARTLISMNVRMHTLSLRETVVFEIDGS